jgi:hypothetical protein
MFSVRSMVENTGNAKEWRKSELRKECTKKTSELSVVIVLIATDIGLLPCYPFTVHVGLFTS